MGLKKRISTQYLNVDDGVVTNEAGVWSQAREVLAFAGGWMVFRFYVRDRGLDALALDGTATYYLGIDSTLGSDHADLASAENSAFNDTDDWSEVDVAQGKICCRINLNTSGINDALGTDEEAQMYATLIVTSGGYKSPLITFPLTVRNFAGDTDSPDTEAGPTYVTAAMLAGYIDQYTDGDGKKCVRIFNADGVLLLDLKPE